MDAKKFIQQISCPTRKVDGNFLLTKDALINATSEVSNLISARKEVSDKRQEIVERNNAKHDQLLNYLVDEIGIDQWKIFKKKKRGRGWTAATVRGDMYAHYKKVFEDLKEYVPMLPRAADFGTSNDRYEMTYNNVNLTLRFHQAHTLEDIFEKGIAEIKRYENSVAKENKLLVASKEFLDKREEDYSKLITAKDIIELADSLATEDYEDSLEGTEIEVTHGDGSGDCEWSVGERRCECGNNRYYLEVEGNLLDGYYSWGQWH